MEMQWFRYIGTVPGSTLQNLIKNVFETVKI